MIRRYLTAAGLCTMLAAPALAYDFSPVPPMNTAAVDRAMLDDVYGVWQISDRSGKKRCRVTLLATPAIGGNGIDIDPQCAKAFPVMNDIAGWRLLESWTIDLIDPLRKTRIRFETPDERYVAFGEESDIAGMDRMEKLPKAAVKKPANKR